MDYYENIIAFPSYENKSENIIFCDWAMKKA